jgi:hypothetical protein
MEAKKISSKNLKQISKKSQKISKKKNNYFTDGLWQPTVFILFLISSTASEEDVIKAPG